jgi:hypothetical protein
MCVKIFVVKFGRTVQIGRPRSRKNDIIKIDLSEMGCEVMDQIEVLKGRDEWRVRVDKHVHEIRCSTKYVDERAGKYRVSVKWSSYI